MSKHRKQKPNSNLELKPQFLNINCDSTNGLYLNNMYLPEEIVIYILSYVDTKSLLRYSLVCRRWNNIIKSITLWSIIYEQRYKRKCKKLPWYLYYCLLSTNYFDTNLLLNGNGQDGLKNWQCKVWDGDIYVESIPIGADPLPAGVPEFNNNMSCFATSYFSGNKMQLIKMNSNKLFRYILHTYKPHIYLSEWTTGRTDCGCVYKLECSFLNEQFINIDNVKPFATHYKPQWQQGKWNKVELLITEYPQMEAIVFENQGHNTQTWKGHYGCKLAGGVVKFLFESIDPLLDDKYGNAQPKQFSKIRFVSNGLQQNEMIDHTNWDVWSYYDNDECYYYMP